MTRHSPFLVAPYAALAAVYDRAGMADFAAQVTPRYLTYVQSLDWAGRRVLELGCGTGTGALWLAQNGYRVLGIDNNPHMLAQAHARRADPSFDAPEFEQADMRQFDSPVGPVDLVMAVNGVLNALTSLRELEQTFASVNRALDSGHFFVFDVHTIRGLAENAGDTGPVTFDNQDDLVITAQRSFNFETLSTTRQYTIWQRAGEVWRRQDELHTERGYPVQGIVAMLDRTGFDVLATLTETLESFDAAASMPDRAVIVAQKRA
jgi:SAM-dependent methyltransferase